LPQVERLADAPLDLRLGQGRLSEPFLFSSSFDTLADAPLDLRLGQGRLSEPFLFSSSFDTPTSLGVVIPQGIEANAVSEGPWG